MPPPAPDISTSQTALIWKHGLYSQRLGWNSLKKGKTWTKRPAHIVFRKTMQKDRERQTLGDEIRQGSMPTGVGIPDTVSSWKQRVNHAAEPAPCPCLGRCQPLAPGLPVSMTVSNKVTWFESTQLVVLCCDSPINIIAAFSFPQKNYPAYLREFCKNFWATCN